MFGVVSCLLSLYRGEARVLVKSEGGTGVGGSWRSKLERFDMVGRGCARVS